MQGNVIILGVIEHISDRAHLTYATVASDLSGTVIVGDEGATLIDPLLKHTHLGAAHRPIAIWDDDGVITSEVPAGEIGSIDLTVTDAQVGIDRPPTGTHVITTETLLTQYRDLWSCEKTEMRAPPIR